MHEFDRMMSGYEKELEDQRRRTAYWVANLMNASGNFAENPITVAGLVGETAEQQDANAEQRKELEERARRRKEERLKARAERGEHNR